MDPVRKVQERENLRNLIAQWNANRLDLFELSEPNDDLEFHGVMRFYFQDAGQKVATKCIRVSSTATALVVIKTLIEKFRPDMRMLSIPKYALYEIHENGEERKLNDDEKPLLVQLNWHKDDREGRFLLRRMDEKTYMTPQHFEDDVNFKRKLSKREKKEIKKREKLQRLKELEELDDEDPEKKIAEKLYTELPETSFTRSISNPEAVMRRRRQQKLERKLQQFRSRDGGPDTGGTLKIYGESLCKDVPYKTLLLSVRDNAANVVKEMLNKYALDKLDSTHYCLVQSLNTTDIDSSGTSPGKEYILDDDECPLSILMSYPPSKGSITFHIRRRPADYQPRKRKKKPKTGMEMDYRYDEVAEKMPYFLELNPDGSEISNGVPHRHYLHFNVTEVGSERSISATGQFLQLFGPNVQPRHCVVAHTDGIVTVTPCSRDSETYVNNQRVFETTILQHGMVLRFGKIHNFRFINSSRDDRRLRRDSASGSQNPIDYYDKHSMKDDSSLQASVLDNSFDVDNNVETVSTCSLKEESRREINDKMNKENKPPPPYERYEPRRQGHDPILPAVLEFREDKEDSFLRSVITSDSNIVQFKLAPTYTLYMAARFCASTHYRPDITPNERAVRLTGIMNKVASMIQHVIQEKNGVAIALAFWMGNASELLHFLKQDRHLNPYTLDAQDVLAESVQVAFRSLSHCLQTDIQGIMPEFLDPRDDSNDEEGITGEVLSVLSSAMSLLRRCRVNAALTIQLFSQLFHFVNMWLFNQLVGDSPANFCTRAWGARLKRRLARVELWAEKQGLELAADCHLSRIAQAAHLLQSAKSTPADIANISSVCFKLNSLQLRVLLENYQPMKDEAHIPLELVDNVVRVAENTADELARTDGRDVRLEEDPDLQLPFLLPEDGYSCDIVRGVPAGLQEFLYPLQQTGLCRLTIQPTSSGYWTIYMSESEVSRTNLRRTGSLGQHGVVTDLSRIGREPEVASIKLQKSNNGMGLSIVAAKGVGQDKQGIYVKSVVKGGAAEADGRLQAGDQLLKVDGQSLVGISQEKAAEYMTRTGPLVTLEVAKQGAIFHGLATLLNQPSPVMQRAWSKQPGPQQPLNSKPEWNRTLPKASQQVPYCQSTPSLNHSSMDEVNSSLNAVGRCHFLSPCHGLPVNNASSLVPCCVKTSVSPICCCCCKSRGGGMCHATSSESFSRFCRISSCDALCAELNTCDDALRKWDSVTNFNPSAHAYKYCITPPRPPRNGNKSVPGGGFANSSSRRLSERDLPSRVSREQAPDLDPGHGPRIQSSKSFPSLNVQEPLRSPTGVGKPPNEVFNPGYSRESSTASVNKEGMVRAPPQILVNGPQQQPRSRPPSQPNLQQQEERFYQNISLYQQSPPTGPKFQENMQQPLPSPKINPQRFNEYPQHVDPYQNQQMKLAYNGYGQVDPRNLRGSQSSLHRPEMVPNVRERPLSAIVSQREREQFMNAVPQSGKGTEEYPVPYHRSEQHIRNDPRSVEMMRNAAAMNGGYFPQVEQRREGFGNPEMRKSERDLIRQEAKMEEMREEVRRREERNREMQARGFQNAHGKAPPPGYYPQQQFQRPPLVKPGPGGPASPIYNQEAQQYPPHLYQGQKPPPPITPKPKVSYIQGPEKPQRHYMQPDNQEVPPERPPLPDEAHLYMESPPPPPPPASTHPLNQNGPNVSYRYGPTGYPPAEQQYAAPPRSPGVHDPRFFARSPQNRVTFDPRLPQEGKNFGSNSDVATALSPSPWEREEREKERKRRLTDARRMRDQEIQELEMMQYRSAKQEERLRTLRLEQEFQRRAEEQKNENDDDEENDDDDDLMERRGLLRMVQEDIERNRLRRLEQQSKDGEKQQQMKSVARMEYQQGTLPKQPPPDEWLKRQLEIKNHRRDQREEEERQIQQKLMEEEMMRQQKLEEVRKKKEQERAAQRELQAAREAEERLLREAQRRQPAATQRLDNLVMPNQGNQQQQNEILPPKRVSFHEPKHDDTNDYDEHNDIHPTSNNNDNVMLATPSNSQQMNSYSSTGISPGVIGAQEVYRDPRMKKMEAQRLNTQQPKGPGPEKLSFKEKMKMFALETGESNSPKDKVKISRAQREIETNLNGN
uniref:Afadin n=1 Tax=Strigamia maritima TaxID=126957 RepID=T1IU86_STRMM